MKLINKKTGEIVVFGEGIVDLTRIGCKNVAEMMEQGWEDYEEPYGYWYIDFDGDVLSCVEPFDKETEEHRKQIGNYFNTKEEAEKAVEKLKAWKRLKDGGVKFELASLADENTITIFARKKNYIHDYDEDLDLLFGGKE